MQLISGRLFLLGFFILIILLIFYRMRNAVSLGKLPNVRRIAAIDALDEAVGRASEKGTALFFMPGTVGMGKADSMQTMAGFGILEYIAEKAAEMGAKLVINLPFPEGVQMAEDVLRTGFTKIGKPEQWREQADIRYFPGTRALETSVIASIQREMPASNVMIGAFFHESVIIGEAAKLEGAFQVTGTATPTQLPFLVCTSDYTLIGEEIFAAGAYLSKNVKLMGSIEGQDNIKLILIFILLIGLILTIAGQESILKEILRI